MRRRGVVAVALLAPVAALGARPATVRAAAALSGRTVQALAWFGGTAYAGTDEGLYRLTSGAWTPVTQIPTTRSVQALAVVGSALVAGTDDGAIRSADGTTWSSAGLSGQSVISLAASGGALLAGTGHDGGTDGLALRSDDGGQTWSPSVSVPAAEGLPGAPVQAVLPPAVGQPALAGTAGSGAFRATTGGGGWSGDSTGLSSTWVTALWRDPSNPAAVLAGTDDGLDQSGGGAWSLAAFPQKDPWIQALATSDGGLPLAGTYDGGVFRRSGGSWTSLASGLPSVLSLLAIPPIQGGGVLAGTFDGAYCIGCSATLGAAAPPPTGPAGAKSPPPVASRPGQSAQAQASRPVARGSGGATPLSSVDGSSLGAAGGASSGGAGGGGVPHQVWYIATGLLVLSALITAWGVRRSRRDQG